MIDLGVNKYWKKKWSSPKKQKGFFEKKFKK